MEARLESAHGSQIQRQEIEKQRAVRLRRQGNHFAFLILSGVVVHPLQVRGLAAETGAVIHQLAINFARRKINERHCSSTLRKPQTYSIRSALRPIAAPPRHLVSYATATSFRDFRRFSQPNFPSCCFSVTPECLWRGMAASRCLPAGLTFAMSNRGPLRPATNGKFSALHVTIEAVSHMALSRACRAKETASRVRCQPP